MKQFSYPACGTCSKLINFELDDQGRIRHLEFVGGCPGNTTGIARLAEGMNATDVIAMLKGVTCGTKPTSCPDQLARALTQALDS